MSLDSQEILTGFQNLCRLIHVTLPFPIYVLFYVGDIITIGMADRFTGNLEHGMMLYLS